MTTLSAASEPAYRLRFYALSMVFALSIRAGWFSMRQKIGFFIQLAVLACLPVVIYLELVFHWLIVMPVAILAGSVLFWCGSKLRES